MNNQKLKTFLIPSKEAMEHLGKVLCLAALKSKQVNKVIHLRGDLGAGKTTLTRGIVQAKSYSGTVKSPTYTLVEEYDFDDISIYHFDLYRLKSPLELESMGIRDYFHDNALCIVEWPEKGENFCPSPDCEVTISIESENKRVVKIISVTPLGDVILNNLEIEDAI